MRLDPEYIREHRIDPIGIDPIALSQLKPRPRRLHVASDGPRPDLTVRVTGASLSITPPQGQPVTVPMAQDAHTFDEVAASLGDLLRVPAKCRVSIDATPEHKAWCSVP
jgi:hypothetical protein